MARNLDHYKGREQAYVKHFFLDEYLESLIHKTGSAYSEIAYVDGFSGPWQSSGENYADTSFGIALAALRKARASWKALGRDVKMTAYLVEKSAGAYANLEAIKPKFPDIEIHTFNSDFVAIAPKLLAQIPPGAFAFFFIDPKGWGIEIAQLAPLLRRPSSEVVFNFMFDFINRAASMGDPKIVAGLNALMPHGGWRERLGALDKAAGDHSSARKAILADAFRTTLLAEGGYTYVAEVPVLQRINNRTLYSLFYGTRHAAGIEVFRQAHLKAERQQAVVRTATKRDHKEQKSGQLGLFGTDIAFARDDISDFLERERQAAREMLLKMSPEAPGTAKYADVWPRILEKHVVSKTDVNAIAAALRKEGLLEFPNWEAGKRVPHDTYLFHRKIPG